MDNPAEALGLTPDNCPGTCAYQDENVSMYVRDGTAFLFYTAAQAAGAIGKAQGDSLLNALNALSNESLQRLQMHINSAGANFHEPLNGLLYLNAFLEALWAYRVQGVEVQVVSTGWLYGGMAMAIAAVAHEIVLSPSASMGLLGKRVLHNPAETVIPTPSFQPTHLKLFRVPDR